jgi:quinol-cytochrome oxidoreductase complex cytochrome b subunit
MPGMIDRAKEWLRERLNIDPIIEFASHKSVPSWKGSFWYYFGGVALFLFIVQVITGILLLMYYQPGEKTAFESVRFIVTKVKFGWLIRSIHSWAANLFILAIFIHMFSVFFTKAFRRPRELTWYSGFMLLGLAMGLGFSGYLLPWNTLAYFATKVGTTIVAVVPVLGQPIMQFLREGKEVTTATLTRFYGLHVAIFPLVFTAVLSLHMLLVQTQGMHEPESWKGLPAEKRKSMPFFPNFILRDLLLWLIVLNLLAVLAVLFPWELGEKANPFAPAPQGIKPEWYFLFMYQALKYFPAKMGPVDGEVVGILFFGLAGLLWFLVPWWDARTPAGARNRTITYIGIFVILFMIVMTAIGVM